MNMYMLFFDAALAHYFDHQQEIDREPEVSTDAEQWKQQVVPHPRAATTPQPAQQTA